METNKSSSTLIATLIIIIVVIVGFGAYMLGKNTSNEVVVENPVTENPVVENPDQTPPAQVDSRKTFTNTTQHFSIKFPADFTFEESNSSGYYNEINLYGLTITAPKSYQANTDFNNGQIVVNVSPKTTLCYSSNGQTQDMTATKIINGKTFHYNPAGPQDDSAMGGQRGTISLLSTIANNQCYRIQTITGYRDLHGFAEPPYPSHYDEAKVSADLDAIVATFSIQ